MKPTARKLRPVADGASIHSLTPKKYISKNLGFWFKGEWKWISVVPQKAKMSQSHDQYNKVSRGPLSTETPSLGLNAHGVIGIPKANIIFLQRSWSKSCWDATNRFGMFWLRKTQPICLADGSSSMCLPTQVTMTCRRNKTTMETIKQGTHWRRSRNETSRKKGLKRVLYIYMCNTCRKWAQEPELNLEMEADIFFATSTGGWTQWTSKGWPQLPFNSCLFSWSQGWSQWAKWHGSPTRRELLTLLLSELLQEFHHRASKRLQNVSLGTNPNGAASNLAGAYWMPPHPRSCPKPTPERKQGEHLTITYLIYSCLIIVLSLSYHYISYHCLIIVLSLSYLVLLPCRPRW